MCPSQVSELEVEVETLTLQQTPELCELDQNGTVTVDDLDHMQKANRDLEQQLSDKNKVSTGRTRNHDHHTGMVR